MTPGERIDAYFQACGEGSADDIASHFTPEAVIWDTNIRPMRGARAIGAAWVKVRERWGGARWLVDTVVASADGATAAIEWRMTGTEPNEQRPFVFRGSEHYRFDDTLIDEIRQYWTFDPEQLDTGLLEYDYDDSEGIGGSEGSP
jgi:hypothetical protein